MNAPRAIVAALLLAFSAGAGAIIFEQREFENAAQLERYKTLIYELRCLVCQNQNLADSDADLAADLRREVYRMIVAGKSDDAIIDFMVTRYGDFVLYRPPLKAKTVLLWAGPFVLAIAGLAVLLVQLRQRKARSSATPLSDEERQRLDEMLEKSDS